MAEEHVLKDRSNPLHWSRDEEDWCVCSCVCKHTKRISQSSHHCLCTNSHFVFRLVHAIGQCSRGGFVDDAQNLKARDLSSVLGCLALRVIEVGGDSDNGIAYRLTQVRICKDNRR